MSHCIRTRWWVIPFGHKDKQTNRFGRRITAHPSLSDTVQTPSLRVYKEDEKFVGESHLTILHNLG